MKQADKVRDDMLAVFGAVINAQQYTHIEAKKVACNALKAVYAPYRGISSHEFSRQTVELDGLLAELQKSENAAHA